MKSSCQTQLCALSVKAAGVTLKLLLASQQRFNFQEMKVLTGIGSSVLYHTLHELRSQQILDFTPSAPGIPASYHLVVSFDDFQQASHQHTNNTNNTNTPDGQIGQIGFIRSVRPDDSNEPDTLNNGGSPPETPSTPTPPSTPNAGGGVAAARVAAFVRYGLSAAFVEWVLGRRMQLFHEPAPKYTLLQQHCQYAQHRQNVKFFPNYVAANFLNPDFNYDTPVFWGVSGIAQESGYRGGKVPKVPKVEEPTPGPSQEGNSDSCPQSSIQEVWQRVLGQVEWRINRPSFNTWLRPTQLVEAGAESWRIGVSDEVCVYWFGEYYRPVLQDAIALATGQQPDIEFVVASPSTEERTSRPPKLHSALPSLHFALPKGR